MVKARKERKPLLKVKAAMVENDIDQREMAEHLNISPSTFNAKINGYSDFWLTEIKEMANVLGIQGDKLNEYFFQM